MSATTTSPTVRVEIQSLIDLLVEIDAVENALAWIGGAYPSEVAADLHRRADAFTIAVFGEPGNEGGTYWEIDRLGRTRAREIFLKIGGAS